MQLPPNVFLYVKDHPHGGNYRNVRDYKALAKIPNVKLIDPQYSGKSLIKKSKGVITINGTAGFEALLLNKHVICFGNAFYSEFKGVNKIKHIRDLAKVLYDLEIADECKIDLIELNYYLNSLHPGFVSYFANRHNILKIDSKENPELVASGIKELIFKIKESKSNEIS
jgi:capsule polysaccharide export protein KpsC/LpsZ